MTYEEAIEICKNSKRLTEQQSKKINRLADNLIYGKRSTNEDKESGVRLYLAAAEANDAHAEYNLGYYYGNGNQKDYERSIEWYLRAAKHGDAWAMNNLSYAYHHGEGVEVNEVTAIFWLKKAAQKDDSLA